MPHKLQETAAFINIREGFSHTEGAAMLEMLDIQPTDESKHLILF